VYVTTLFRDITLRKWVSRRFDTTLPNDAASYPRKTESSELAACVVARCLVQPQRLDTQII